MTSHSSVSSEFIDESSVATLHTGMAKVISYCM